MNTLPGITISSLDADRLEKLLETTHDRDFAGKDNLEAELLRANIVAPEAMPDNVVSMNSTVRFRVKSTGEVFTRTLVYPKDMDDLESKISILAPVGSALLGLEQGSSIDWPNPTGGNLSVVIEEIMFQPERAGQLHR
ncbi:MAG: nucleoside diphosphate kinase regulator [Wenzhouxiangella sp.]|nr:nucleoside diphosphate kinase regulator [Wenzhouxiangella sp.]MCH8479109.1 nucleoside diphosphate kinase regulator [Wenzhouxiangella sp.]TVR91978.1 MAG: nucleoside diphosphate kinase regulator [Wenzhouxiangellaceae bacterium]